MGGCTYTTVGSKHVETGEVDLVASVSSASQASQGVVSSTGGHVGRHGRGCRGRRCGGGLGLVAGSALDHVDGIVVLDLVVAERVVVLHDAAGVDQALPLNRDVLEVLAGQLGLEFEDGGSLGHGDGVDGVR